MTDPTPRPHLSPAAQAVLDAYGDFEAANVDAMAAALRAAADQVVPLRGAPKIPFNAKRPTVEWHTWNALQLARASLFAIAAELEGTP